MTLGAIARVVGGSVAPADADVVVSGAAYLDSRRPVPDGLFVAIEGEHVDGHDFAAGAHAVLGSRPTAAPTVVVTDPVAALGLLAAHVVRRLPATVVALTGSSGKTGTKDYLAQVLASVAPTVATAASFNNELGLPLTVLGADEQTSYLVLEMGARGDGHIGYLCRIAPPTISSVLNIGSAHLGEFGSREGIARAKAEIVEALPAEGTAVLNADDEFVDLVRSRTSAHVLTFGVAGDVTWRDVELDDLGRPSFELGHAGEWHPVALRLSGAHQVLNAAAAAALALAAGVPLATSALALSEAGSASPMRMEMHERADGLLVVNDAYNANPASMRAALEALVAIGGRRGGRTVAVLGEMRELGPTAYDEHVGVGRTAAELGVDVLVSVGPEADGIAEGFRAAGGGDTFPSAGRVEALERVRENVASTDVVLVKASRGAALESIADGLLEGGAPAP